MELQKVLEFKMEEEREFMQFLKEQIKGKRSVEYLKGLNDGIKIRNDLPSKLKGHVETVINQKITQINVRNLQKTENPYTNIYKYEPSTDEW